MHDARVPIISTAELHRWVAGGGRLWLAYAADPAAFAAGHIPGSLAASTDLPPALFAATPVVVYGADGTAVRATALAGRLAAHDVAVSWYAGGLRAWVAAGLAVDRLGGG
jgi:rhodanese-related sulfurtransferase